MTMAYDDRDGILQRVYDEMAEGKSVEDICSLDDMPNAATIYRWLVDEAKCEKYVRAKEVRADRMADDIVKIADDVTMSADDRRIAIDARKWRAGKLSGKYSDKVKHVGGDDGDNPIAFTGFDVQFV
jgi:hypothetical protein